jgi:hypothetical protein
MCIQIDLEFLIKPSHFFPYISNAPVKKAALVCNKKVNVTLVFHDIVS